MNEGCAESDCGMSGYEAFVHGAFAADGLFSRAKDFEYRPQQQQMALAVARALQIDAPLLVEAGTGVGKSLGYLLPAVKYALDYGRKAVISTHTINLQEQLFNKDIPLLRQALGVDFTAALLKGRHNYLCNTRLRRALAQMNTLFTQHEAAELKRIQDWALRTEDGTLSDMNFKPSPKVWAMVCSEPHICSLRNCGPNCPYQAAHRRMMEAKVVVLNHTLFFALMAHGGADEDGDDGFILPGDFAILDEAHEIETIAATQLGVQLSETYLNYELLRMFNQRPQKGMLKPINKADLFQREVEVLDAAGLFFEQAAVNLGMDGALKIKRIGDAEWTKDLVSLSEPLSRLMTALKDEATAQEENPSAKDELIGMATKIEGMFTASKALMEMSEPDHVYWAEKIGVEGKSLLICSAPIEVGDILRERLFSAGRSAILTSATLGAGDADMSYFAGRVGAENVQKLRIGSPFNYREQMRLIVARSMPDPTTDEYAEALPEWIIRYLTESRGKAFVLFTSYRLMLQMAEKVRPFCERQGWTLYVQGQGGMQRSALLDAFKRDVDSVLFGTDSFWTGVDVPGETLSNVIVTRLPFEVPDHPLVQSRSDRINARNGNAFMEYSVPVAILKLRQGVGRLIRTKKDSGMVVLLDSRVMTKRFGVRFLRALPDARIEVV